MSTESPPLAGVIGWPIGHSKSPQLHGHWLKRYGINGHYVPIALHPEKFEDGLRALMSLGFKGVNVTLPFKENVLSIATSISDRAALIGAANTLVFRENGGVRADNTDGYGFISNLKQNAPHWDVKAGPVLVLGAGGASRGVVSALLEEGANEVRISNRTRHRADLIKDQFGAKVTVVDWARINDATDGVGTLVNTTSLGMEGQPPLKIRLSGLPKSALVTDLVYTPLKTELLQSAEEFGLETVDGVGMLLHQAAPGFEAWFDQRPVVDDELRAAVLAG